MAGRAEAASRNARASSERTSGRAALALRWMTATALSFGGGAGDAAALELTGGGDEEDGAASGALSDGFAMLDGGGGASALEGAPCEQPANAIAAATVNTKNLEL